MLPAQCPGQPVPVCEVGGVVVLGLEVVEAVVAGPAVQAKWHQAMGGPGQVIAAVVLHRQVDVEQEEGELSERVAAQQDGVGGCKETKTESLPDPRVLCGEGRGGGVGMVHLVEEKTKHEVEQQHD